MTRYRDRREAGEFEPPGEQAAAPGESALDALPKGELIERAQALGISPANASMSKAELAAAIEQVAG